MGLDTGAYQAADKCSTDWTMSTRLVLSVKNLIVTCRQLHLRFVLHLTQNGDVGIKGSMQKVLSSKARHDDHWITSLMLILLS